MSNNLIYLEFNKNHLFISKLKNKKNKFLLTNEETICFNNLEIKNGILYNLSVIYSNVKNFLNKNNLKKSKSIIFFPYLYKKETLKQKLNILQLALCICKTGLKIEKIIGISILKKAYNMPFKNFFYKKDLENQLDFFKTFSQTKNNHPFKWILFTIMSLSCLITTMFIIHLNTKEKFNFLINQNIELINANKLLEKKVLIFHNIKKENDLIKSKIEKIKKIKNNRYSPENILIETAKNIPDSSWLTKIKFNKLKNKNLNIDLEGLTIKEHEITTFKKNLSKSPIFKTVKLTKIQNHNSKEKCLFKIQAKYKN